MQLSDVALAVLARVITGDGDTPSPYMSGKELMAFFGQFPEINGAGGSRYEYTLGSLNEANGSPILDAVIESYLDERRFFGCDSTVDDAAHLLNTYLDHDGYRVVRKGRRFEVIDHGHIPVKGESEFTFCTPSGAAYLQEQLDKCQAKVAAGDYDGAITNARSLVETVLVELEHSLDPAAGEYNGDLIKLYRRVQALLNLDPSAEATDPIRQILSGLTSIINGLAGLRNKMSDAHAPNYRPARHHAKLAVNAATTLTDFLLDTIDYQKSRREESA